MSYLLASNNDFDDDFDFIHKTMSKIALSPITDIVIVNRQGFCNDQILLELHFDNGQILTINGAMLNDDLAMQIDCSKTSN